MPQAPIGTNGTHNRQDRYANTILKLLRKNLVTENPIIFDSTFEGNPTAGSVQIPVRDTEVLVSDYDIAAGIDPNQSATTFLTFPIENNKAVNELIFGYEAAAVPDNLVAQRLDSAAYSLGLTIDTDRITTLEAGGTTSTNTVASVPATIYDNILDENTELDLADVPADGRWIIISPLDLNKLKKDPRYADTSDTTFSQIKEQGNIGMVDGLPVFVSNNMDANTEFIIGNRMWTQKIMEWSVMPALFSLDQSANFVGSSSIKGLIIYGNLVTRAVAVRIKTFV